MLPLPVNFSPPGLAAAKDADIAIVFGSAKSGEGHDRANLSLDGNSDDVIAAVSRVQKNAIVVMTVPGSVLTPWRDEVPAILTNFFPGEQVGPALGDIIFGVVSPSAKLPVTMPNLENEQRMTMSCLLCELMTALEHNKGKKLKKEG